MTHTIRTIRCTLHGFVASQATHGFEWSQHPEETSGWMIRFIDYSLRAIRHHAEDDAAGAPSAQIISLCLEKMMDIQPAPGAQIRRLHARTHQVAPHLLIEVAPSA